MIIESVISSSNYHLMNNTGPSHAPPGQNHTHVIDYFFLYKQLILNDTISLVLYYSNTVHSPLYACLCTREKGSYSEVLLREAIIIIYNSDNY